MIKHTTLEDIGGDKIYLTVDDSTHTGEITTTFRDDDDDSEAYNAAIDGMESLILALACEGYDICHPKFKKAIEVSVEAIVNHLG